MLSDPVSFFRLVVEPTVAEFCKFPLDLRRGMLAAIVLNHIADYMAQEGKPADTRQVMNHRLKGVRDDMQSVCDEIKFIRDVADVSKHAKLTKVLVRDVSTVDNLSMTPGLFSAPFGEGVFAEAAQIIVILDDGTEKPLLPAVIAAYEAWQSRLCP
ncbi:hypothetical protein [Oryzomicrobium sp.]|uniref:hypothetical protein n=1 Tax=Oryzomicrobium sp. TaxID=1911578 RepID=UPI002600D2D0|nr:hypothetical protein [Oryzomicrobium sp.]MCE1243998.1 hypothetical protein [Oryzomicrobium sp.]